jgi:hypothetical protein
MARHRKIEDGLLRRFASRNDDADSCASSTSLRAQRSNPWRNSKKNGLLRRFASVRKSVAFVAGNDSGINTLASQAPQDEVVMRGFRWST